MAAEDNPMDDIPADKESYEAWEAVSRENHKRAVNLFQALEMVRASIDEVSCLVELDRRIRRDLQQISRFIDLTLKEEKP